MYEGREADDKGETMVRRRAPASLLPTELRELDQIAGRIDHLGDRQAQPEQETGAQDNRGRGRDGGPPRSGQKTAVT